MIEALKLQTEYTYRTLKSNTAGLSHEDSLLQPQSAGNCLNWVAGHILATRCHWLTLLGEPPIWQEAEIRRYRRGSTPIMSPEDAVPLDRILTDLDVSQQAILRGLNALTADQLAANASSDPGSDETLGSGLALLIFHEAYHVGQTGILRRIIGRESAIK
jgi:uncharacterized damage-inducible protein DinB